jgi:hypothetical protein
MRTKISLLLVGTLIVLCGCVGTVSGDKTWGVPLIKDKMEGRYDRPLDDCFTAAKDVIKANGVLESESILHSETNAVKTVTGKVNQRSVWVRVEALEPRITAVVVQARTKGGGSDLELTHLIEKEIALKLVR